MITDVTLERFRYDSPAQIDVHLQLFVEDFDLARRPRTLRGLAPFEFIRQTWTREPDRFRLDPLHLTAGPYT